MHQNPTCNIKGVDPCSFFFRLDPMTTGLATMHLPESCSGYSFHILGEDIFEDTDYYASFSLALTSPETNVPCKTLLGAPQHGSQGHRRTQTPPP